MYGQMTAGSWIYIGTQGILQGTYETLAECAHQHFGGSLAGTVTLTGGLGGMGGAQPLAVTMNDGVALCVEVDPARIERRDRDPLPRSRDRRPRRRPCAGPTRRRRPGEAVSIGLVGNCAEVLPELLRSRTGSPTSSPTRPAPTTRSAATCPTGLSLRRSRRRCGARPEEYVAARRTRRWRPRRGHGGVRGEGRGRRSTTATTCAPAPKPAGFAHDVAFSYPGFVPAFVRPLFCEGKGPFRWAALSGDPADIAATDAAVAELFPENERLQRWLAAGRGAGRVPGAAGADLLARLRRARPRGRAVQRAGGDAAR